MREARILAPGRTGPRPRSGPGTTRGSTVHSTASAGTTDARRGDSTSRTRMTAAVSGVRSTAVGSPVSNVRRWRSSASVRSSARTASSSTIAAEMTSASSETSSPNAAAIATSSSPSSWVSMPRATSVRSSSRAAGSSRVCSNAVIAAASSSTSIRRPVTTATSVMAMTPMMMAPPEMTERAPRGGLVGRRDGRAGASRYTLPVGCCIASPPIRLLCGSRVTCAFVGNYFFGTESAQV